MYTIAGANTARPLPEWLIRKRKRSLKTDPEFANRIELLQDFEFEEASSCVRASEDGNWVMSTGMFPVTPCFRDGTDYSQAHINHRYMSTISHICPFPSPDTQTLSIRPSYSSPPTTPNHSISSPTASSNFTLLKDATTQREYRDTAEI